MKSLRQFYEVISLCCPPFLFFYIGRKERAHKLDNSLKVTGIHTQIGLILRKEQLEKAPGDSLHQATNTELMWDFRRA